MFNVFRQVDTPVSKLKRAAIVMQIVFFGGVIAAVATFSFLWETGGLAIGVLPLIVSLLVLIALPFVPGIIVRGEFRDDVIPACRRVCTEREIVSGALQSLRFLWGRYLLYLLPLIAIFLGLAVCYCFSQLGSVPVRELGWLMVLSIAVVLLGDCALAVFPVARLFSRRIGMIVMVVLIFLAQIVLLLHAMLLRIGFPYFTDGDVKVKETNAFAGNLSTFCLMLFAFSFGYFLYVSYTDAKEKGLLY